jgi:Glycine-zipper domain
MQSTARRVAAISFLIPAIFALGGCAVAPPTGPSVVAMPAQGKSFEQFRADDAACRQYASTQIGGVSPAEAANKSLGASAAVGTVLGAAAGAAIGAATGNPGAGAAIGAGSGLALGTLSGLGAADASSASLQWRYDVGYVQCMSAKGESVPQTVPAPYAYAYPTYPYYYPPYYYGWDAPFYFSFRGGYSRWHH